MKSHNFSARPPYGLVHRRSIGNLGGLAPSARVRRGALPTVESRAELERRRLRRRHLVTLETWALAAERAGYRTQLSLASPAALVVRQRSMGGRWVALSTNGTVALFEAATDGSVSCHHDQHFLTESPSSVVELLRDVLGDPSGSGEWSWEVRN